MDYGAWLKQNEGNFGKQAKKYRPQSPFNGSMRQLRGAILKSLLETSPLPVDIVAERLSIDPERIYSCALQLAQEGFLEIQTTESAEGPESARWPESAAADSILLNLP
jgi:A/G-specific adenine glycosylase